MKKEEVEEIDFFFYLFFSHKITECFYNLAGVYEEVFFEVGTIVGAKIGMQLQKKLQELQ